LKSVYKHIAEIAANIFYPSLLLVVATMSFICISCGREQEHSALMHPECKYCGDLLEWKSDPDIRVVNLLPPPQEFTLWRYSLLLPVSAEGKRVTLSEGGTPLHFADRLSSKLDMDELFLKNEGKNPTGSFKDRGMSVAVSIARSMGFERAICASTGNTASSMAAYCAKADMEACVIVPEGHVAPAKLKQSQAYGATVVEVRGNFDQALQMVREISAERGYALMNSINPFRIEGQKTAAFEICDQLSSAPDWLVIPVGNGGNITSYWKGFREFRALGVINTLPRLVAVQASGASPIANAFNAGSDAPVFVERPETAASAIRIGRPANWKRALRALVESEGRAVAVNDSDIANARLQLAEEEGLLAEMASASTIAAASKLRREGTIKSDDTVVCVITGNGLKDLDDEIRGETLKAEGISELRKML